MVEGNAFGLDFGDGLLLLDLGFADDMLIFAE